MQEIGCLLSPSIHVSPDIRVTRSLTGVEPSFTYPKFDGPERLASSSRDQMLRLIGLMDVRRKKLRVLEHYVNQRFGDIERALHLVHHTVQQIESTYLAALRTFESGLARRVDLIAGTSDEVKNDLDRVSGVLKILTKDMSSSVENLHSEVLAFQATINERTENRLSSLTKDVSEHVDVAVSQLRESVAERLEVFAREITALGSEMRVSHDDLRILATSHSAAPTTQRTDTENFSRTGAIDSTFYAALERRFRGPEDEVLTRFDVYEDIVRELPEFPEPFVDLGCGRGEFLTFLREHGISAVGVDSDPSAIDRCVRSGLNVQQQSLLTYLQNASDDSVRGISLFHVIEHFTVDDALTILRQCRRVIRSSGILIVETPNPKNLRVGSANFWLDPTHVRPYPPELLRFMVEFVGFEYTDTRFLRGNEKIYSNDLLQTGGKLALDAMITAVDGPLDYAVTGRVI